MREMKSVSKSIVTIVIIILTIVGIYFIASEPEDISESDWAIIYSLALDETIPLDDALNHDMEYISIDLSSLPNLDEESAGIVLDYFEKYGVRVRGDSITDLDELGMVGRGGDLDGILLYIEEVEQITNRQVIINCAKVRSGVGAIGMKVELKKDGNTWVVENAGSTWIS